MTATATATVSPSELAELLGVAVEMAKGRGGALTTAANCAVIVCGVVALLAVLFPGWPQPGWVAWALRRALGRQQQQQHQEPDLAPASAPAPALALAPTAEEERPQQQK